MSPSTPEPGGPALRGTQFPTSKVCSKWSGMLLKEERPAGGLGLRGGTWWEDRQPLPVFPSPSPYLSGSESLTRAWTVGPKCDRGRVLGRTGNWRHWPSTLRRIKPVPSGVSAQRHWCGQELTCELGSFLPRLCCAACQPSLGSTCSKRVPEGWHCPAGAPRFLDEKGGMRLGQRWWG